MLEHDINFFVSPLYFVESKVIMTFRTLGFTFYVIVMSDVMFISEKIGKTT